MLKLVFFQNSGNPDTEKEKSRKENSRLSINASDSSSNMSFFALLFAFFIGADKETLAKGGAADKLSDALGLDNTELKQTVSNVVSGETTAVDATISTVMNIADKANVTPLPNKRLELIGGGGGGGNNISKDAWLEYIEHLNLREGSRNDVYKCSEGYLTVGVGHRVLPEDGLKFGDVISDEQIQEFLKKDALKALKSAQKQAEVMGTNDPEIIKGLASVNFQLGENWTSKFHKTWPAIINGDYETAINNLEKSKWNTQTPTRVDDFQKVLMHASNSRNTQQFNNGGVVTPDPQQPEILTSSFNTDGVNEIIAAAQQPENHLPTDITAKTPPTTAPAA